MTLRKPRQLYIICAFLVSALALLLLRGVFSGIRFFCDLACWACLFGAVFTLLTWPWAKPGRRKAARILRRLCYIALSLLLLSFIVVEAAIWQTARQAEDSIPTASYVLVLGAGLYGDQPSAILEERLHATLSYLQENPQAVAVLSGGQGSDETVPEAQAMQRWLTDRGIAAERLTLESQATSTAENIAYSLPLLQELGAGQETVLVTNDFHLLRAEKLARFYGLKPQLLGCPLPDLPLVPLSNYLREYFALVKDLLRLVLFPESFPQAVE